MAKAHQKNSAESDLRDLTIGRARRDLLDPTRWMWSAARSGTMPAPPGNARMQRSSGGPLRAVAQRCRIEAIVALGRSIRRHRDAIDQRLLTGTTNALVESTNTKLRGHPASTAPRPCSPSAASAPTSPDAPSSPRPPDQPMETSQDP